jgi:hypothetical protein
MIPVRKVRAGAIVHRSRRLPVSYRSGRDCVVVCRARWGEAGRPNSSERERRREPGETPTPSASVHTTHFDSGLWNGLWIPWHPGR